MGAARFESAYVPDVIPDDDLAYFDRAGHGARGGWGDAPGVLVVDMTEAFTTERPAIGTPAVSATAALLEASRAAALPVVFTRPDRDLPEGYPGTTKPKAGGSPGRSGANVIDDRLALRDGEYVLDKPRASAFFDTHLAAMYRAWGVDTLLVTGLTTSGCVRASVVDAHSHNFDVVVVAEGTGDRSTISHEVSLFDLDMKYADVTPLADVLDRLAGLEPGR